MDPISIAITLVVLFIALKSFFRSDLGKAIEDNTTIRIIGSTVQVADEVQQIAEERGSSVDELLNNAARILAANKQKGRA